MAYPAYIREFCVCLTFTKRLLPTACGNNGRAACAAWALIHLYQLRGRERHRRWGEEV